MIAFVVVMGIALVIAVFAVLPPLPAIPSGLLAFNDQLEAVLMTGIQLIRYILTPELTFVVLLVLIAIYTFEPVYHGVMWILRKIPGLGIQ